MSVSLSACLDGHPFSEYIGRYHTVEDIAPLVTLYVEHGLMDMETALFIMLEFEAMKADFYTNYLPNYVRH